MIAGEKAAVDSKEKIRARYRGVDPSELEVIPAIATDEIALDQRKLKVAAYVRVSTENDEQTSWQGYGYRIHKKSSGLRL